MKQVGTLKEKEAKFEGRIGMEQLVRYVPGYGNRAEKRNERRDDGLDAFFGRPLLSSRTTLVLPAYLSIDLLASM